VYAEKVNGTYININKDDLRTIKEQAHQKITKFFPNAEGLHWWWYSFDDDSMGLELRETAYRESPAQIVPELLIVLKEAYTLGFILPDYCISDSYSDNISSGCIKITRVDDGDVQVSLFKIPDKDVVKSGTVGSVTIFNFDDLKYFDRNFMEYFTNKKSYDLVVNTDK
jgi:hypothetical protein